MWSVVHVCGAWCAFLLVGPLLSARTVLWLFVVTVVLCAALVFAVFFLLAPTVSPVVWRFGAVLCQNGAVQRLSTWLASRARSRPLTTIVVHSSAGSTSVGALSWLRRTGLSYHYLVDKGGGVTKAVPVSRVAFHAGRSVGPQGPDVNSYSVGVCLVNMNDGRDPYTDAQEKALVSLCAELCAAEPGIKWLTSHRLVSPGRKTDPVGFKMSRLASSLAVSLKGRAPRLWGPDGVSLDG